MSKILAAIALRLAFAGGGGSDSSFGDGSSGGSNDWSSGGSYSGGDGGGNRSVSGDDLKSFSPMALVLLGGYLYGRILIGRCTKADLSDKAEKRKAMGAALIGYGIIWGASVGLNAWAGNDGLVNLLTAIAAGILLLNALVRIIGMGRSSADVKPASYGEPLTGDEAQAVYQLFLRYQRDWGCRDSSHFAEYMTPYYAEQSSLMVEAFIAAGRRNYTQITNYHGAYYDKDSIPGVEAANVWIEAEAVDVLVDERTNEVLVENHCVMREEWRFVRQAGKLLLDGVYQPTADLSTREEQIKAFAARTGAYYLLDWGRMLLPRRGMIFDTNGQGTADINNYVIGRLGDTGHAVSDGVVYQLFTYSKVPYHLATKVYLVGELVLPNTRGGLVAVRKSSHRLPPKGMRAITFESGEFNSLYDVYVAPGAEATAYELLHPAMLDALVVAPYSINIEVTDNIVYFYAELKQTDASNYAAMLSILQTAYRELYL